MTRPPLRLAALGLLLAVAGGCNNPFDPKADIELVELAPTEIRVYQSQISPTLDVNQWAGGAVFLIKNKVGVNLSGVDLVYTDLNGNEVTTYKSTGGRHFKFAFRIDPVTNNDRFDRGEGLATFLSPLFIVDRNVISELQSPAYPSNGYMFVDITFRGEDDNGHDVKLTGRMTIKYF